MSLCMTFSAKALQDPPRPGYLLTAEIDVFWIYSPVHAMLWTLATKQNICYIILIMFMLSVLVNLYAMAETTESDLPAAGNAHCGTICLCGYIPPGTLSRVTASQFRLRKKRTGKRGDFHWLLCSDAHLPIDLNDFEWASLCIAIDSYWIYNISCISWMKHKRSLYKKLRTNIVVVFCAVEEL